MIRIFLDYYNDLKIYSPTIIKNDLMIDLVSYGKDNIVLYKNNGNN